MVIVHDLNFSLRFTNAVEIVLEDIEVLSQGDSSLKDGCSNFDLTTNTLSVPCLELSGST